MDEPVGGHVHVLLVGVLAADRGSEERAAVICAVTRDDLLFVGAAQTVVIEERKAQCAVDGRRAARRVEDVVQVAGGVLGESLCERERRLGSKRPR